jgi:hypothetical protein
MTQVVEHLPSKCKDQSASPSTAKKNFKTPFTKYASKKENEINKLEKSIQTVN